MIYLIQYDRLAGSLVRLQAFNSNESHEAEESRLSLELALLKATTSHEVVLLEASSELELRKTHRRYFESLEELLTPLPALAV
jgi:ribosome-binding ATPase YchF (GTP1/OBG family)